MNPRTQAVPRERILECHGGFPQLDRRRIVSMFRKLHDRSEKVYNGDGSWGRGVSDAGVFDNVNSQCARPLMRMSYTRLSAYLAMGKEDDSGLYLRRAREAADFLVREQRPDGYFPYYLEDSGWPLCDCYGLTYVTGFSAMALLDAYRHFGEGKYLDAALKACLWGARFPCVANYNYNSIVISMLVRTAEMLKKQAQPSREEKEKAEASIHMAMGRDMLLPEYLLDKATKNTMSFIIPGQQPNGGYLGHNSWIWYHGIITEGNALVLRAMAETHPDYKTIWEAVIGNINYIVINQKEDGCVYANYETEETTPGGTTHVIVALLALRDVFGSAVDELLAGLANRFLDNVEKYPGIFYNKESKSKCESTMTQMKGLSLLYSITERMES